jgi:hypothetical protein
MPPQAVCPDGQAAQTPLVHTLPDGQACPQVPQLFGSLASLTQALLHSTSPDGQPQTPAVQDAPDAQTCPHAPQLFGSDVSVTHLLPHTTCPEGQLPVALQLPPLPLPPVGAEHTQAPELHEGAQEPPLPPDSPVTAPQLQTSPQAPQLLGSVLNVVQTPLHSVCPTPQPPLEVLQAPLTQVVPWAHTLPQLPQLFGSVASLVQVPLHETCGEVQPPLDVPQLPLTQGAPLAHAVPQAPQLEGSEEGVVQ